MNMVAICHTWPSDPVGYIRGKEVCVYMDWGQRARVWGETVNYSDDTIPHENVSNACSDIQPSISLTREGRSRRKEVSGRKLQGSWFSSFLFSFFLSFSRWQYHNRYKDGPNFGPALTVTTLLKCSYLCVCDPFNKHWKSRSTENWANNNNYSEAAGLKQNLQSFIYLLQEPSCVEEGFWVNQALFGVCALSLSLEVYSCLERLALCKEMAANH